ncbi:MAG: hypothetical protein WBM71_01955 [Sedimenticolaceae bacterium]
MSREGAWTSRPTNPSRSLRAPLLRFRFSGRAIDQGLLDRIRPETTPADAAEECVVNVTQIDNDKLMWYVIIHMTFVLSALGMVLVDRLNHH